MLDPTDYSFLQKIELTHENTKNLHYLKHPLPEGTSMRQTWHLGEMQHKDTGKIKPLNWFTFSISLLLPNGQKGWITGTGCAAVPCLTDKEQQWNVVTSKFSHGKTEIWLSPKDPELAKQIENTGMKANAEKYAAYCMQVAKEYVVNAYAEANEKLMNDEVERLREAGDLLSQSMRF